MSEPPVQSAAALLRQEFDAAFAEAPRASVDAAFEDFLGIRVAGQPYALRALEIIRWSAHCTLLPLPASQPDFLGLAGWQGELLPVYSLAALLGHGREAGEGRWLAVCGREQRLGLAIAGFDGFLRVARGAVFGLGAPERRHDHVQEALRFADGIRHVVRVSSMIAAIGQQLAAAASR
ncbi:MAG: chemotaxis protein CheW [Planctomycetia bacterium]|nr:chemotaxis protein CheW [Planctomycetia bacterium]